MIKWVQAASLQPPKPYMVWCGKRWSQKFHPTFKICSNTWQANKLIVESLLKERGNPRFCSSLRDVMDDSIHFQTYMINKNMLHRYFNFLCFWWEHTYFFPDFFSRAILHDMGRGSIKYKSISHSSNIKSVEVVCNAQLLNLFTLYVIWC